MPVRIVVIGGVAAGMSCAARARRLDESAEIIVLEKGDYVSFANCGLPYYVGGEITSEDALLVQTPQKLKDALNLDVRTNHEVTSLNPEEKTVSVATPAGQQTISYDALVVSPGAKALRPPLPGLDSQRVHTLRTVNDARTIHQQVAQAKGQAVVLGAGFIGIEAAEALAHQGWKVALVELAPHVLPPLEIEIANPIRQELLNLGIEVHDGVGAQEVVPGPDHDQVKLSDGTMLPADLVILSIGVRPDTAIFEQAGIETERGAIVIDSHGRTSTPSVWAAGDATLSTDEVTGIRRPVALAGPANRGGRLIADDIINPENARPFPAPIGTAIVRVGGLTAAMTGANRAALDQAGIQHQTLHLHPNQHAGYFPGAKSMSLLVHVGSPNTELAGKILGAQAVGPEGVDKRIDVLATAIRNQMRVEDLIDLDLSYSPPYGMAKDPVNLVGMLGENLLQGEIKLWYFEQLDWARENALIIDVRSSAEFATGHIKGAINIAHTEIRQQLEEIRQQAGGRPVQLICHSGFRSYLAYRILVQENFDQVATFSGGMLTFKAIAGSKVDEMLEKGGR